MLQDAWAQRAEALAEALGDDVGPPADASRGGGGGLRDSLGLSSPLSSRPAPPRKKGSYAAKNRARAMTMGQVKAPTSKQPRRAPCSTFCHCLMCLFFSEKKPAQSTTPP